MKLEVRKNGVKLFFITCVVEGRRPLLSRLVDENSRPELLELGELVKAAILAIHKIWPAVGTSDFVIMPKMAKNPAAAHSFRASCLAMNEIGTRLCEEE